MPATEPGFDTATAKTAINAAMELFHKRWMLRIIWELRRGGMTFREVRSACSEISPTVLNQRLVELREAGIVTHAAGTGYQLSAQGAALLKAMWPLMGWSVAWWREGLRKRPRRRPALAPQKA
ncbi:MAG: helix-turn-helix domain-containing protein [Betaproteobacteria bacterium]